MFFVQSLCSMWLFLLTQRTQSISLRAQKKNILKNNTSQLQIPRSFLITQSCHFEGQ